MPFTDSDFEITEGNLGGFFKELGHVTRAPAKAYKTTYTEIGKSADPVIAGVENEFFSILSRLWWILFAPLIFIVIVASIAIAYNYMFKPDPIT